MEQDFDENSLLFKLRPLSYPQKTLFTLSCCERLYPNYEVFFEKHNWGDHELLRNSLDLIWSLFEENKRLKKTNTLLKDIDKICPDTEEFNSIYVSPALDSAVSIILLIEFIINGSTKKIVEAASLARDTVDMYVQVTENIQPDNPNLEKMILEHPLMQKELIRQRETIEILSKPNISISEQYRIIKNKWYKISKSNIDLVSQCNTV